jgi:hypothetical protein
MDKELEEAQNLTKDDLLAKLRSGRPAELARHLSNDLERADALLRRPVSGATIVISSSSYVPELRGIPVGCPTGISAS